MPVESRSRAARLCAPDCPSDSRCPWIVLLSMSATTSSASACGSTPGRQRSLGVDKGLADGVEWRFQRNCSLTPRELVRSYLVLCALSFGVAAFFWVRGVGLVIAFAGLEMLAVGMAMLIYARHARDQETIAMRARRLHVEHRCGSRLEQADFDLAWVRVEPTSNDRSLIELSGQGRQIAVGRFLRPELRVQLAEELRHALRRWRMGEPAPGPLNSATL